MVAAMRTILEDILPYMNTDIDMNDNNDKNDDDENGNESENGNDDGNGSDSNTQRKKETETHNSTIPGIGTHVKFGMNTDTDEDIHSTKETMRGREKDNINSSHNIQNKTAQSFEFYPHISPKLADNWDFKATLEAVSFPSNDSINVAEWLKKRRKQDDFKNCVGGIPVSKGGNVGHTSNTEQSKENHTNTAIDGDVSDGTSITPELVLDPLLVSTTAPTPVTAPGPPPVPVPIPVPNPTPYSVPTPIPVPVPIPVPIPTPDQPSIDQLGSLAIQMGDFTKIYGHIDQENQFDCVVTCFFIDTASDILEYLAVIAHVLREGIVFLLYVCHLVVLKS